MDLLTRAGRICLVAAVAATGLMQIINVGFVRLVPKLPDWLPAQAFGAVVTGAVLVLVGGAVLMEYKPRLAANVLAGLLVVLFGFRLPELAPNSGALVNPAKVLALLGGALLLGGGVLLGQRQAQIDRQAPAARQTELNHGIANRLAAYIDRKPQPLEMLAYLNDLRPRSISYQKVSIENSAQLVIECATATPADVNEYEASLKKAPAIASAEARNIRTRSEGGSTFQLSVAFRPGFSAAKAPAAEAPVSAGPVAPQTVSVQP